MDDIEAYQNDKIDLIELQSRLWGLNHYTIEDVIGLDLWLFCATITEEEEYFEEKFK
ncbi:hypothetical protein BN424_1490 [Carnobacterium maltaromaticum LMA28]|uniref:Uncharacterized protein n=1 Tax=Carnobacterium maltaromaticum LMA28 TaxID=1234679 RepID=K8EQX1_CARML|nr:hypothetical protein BN424_1490 [Carnobacterium maltaromaticum LMA28]